MLIRLAIAITLSPLMLVADMMPADPPCVLLCAGNLPNAVTQLGLIPAPVGFPPNGVTFNGDGGSQATVQILNQEGDVIGAASAAGESIGASRTISVGGGQLNNFGSVSANAGVTIDPDFFATASAHTIFDFWVQLVPPQCGSPPLPPCPTGFIPITITDRFDIGFVPGSGNAVAQVKVSGDFGPSQPLLFADEFFDPVNTAYLTGCSYRRTRFSKSKWKPRLTNSALAAVRPKQTPTRASRSIRVFRAPARSVLQSVPIWPLPSRSRALYCWLASA